MTVMPQMVQTAFSTELASWSEELEALRQNWLLSESSFISFARDRGIGISGVVTGELSKLHTSGWLSADGIVDNDLLFHPFRILVLHARSAGNRLVLAKARESNEIVDLAIMLEPIYWPAIIGHVLGDHDRESRLEEYQQRALGVVRRLDPHVWRKHHERLRLDAASMDANGELYVLLRLCLWEQRKSLRGQISGALWIRHLAEVLRRGFEAAHNVQWQEEDEAFGHWPTGACARVFGSERPLDDELRSKPYLAYRFGLFTGSALRWYVEGETEYYGVLHMLDDPSRWGVELWNLHGEIAKNQSNAPLKLEDALKEDLALKRFSVISFDRDVKANERAVRRQIAQHHVVGLINANNPDFEFANFSLSELVEIAASLDERFGLDGEKIRTADWNGVKGSKVFAERYARVSERACSLKGKAWGEALAEYAIKHPVNAGTGMERPISRAVSAAYWAWHSNYEFQKSHFTFDPQTFETRRLP